MSKLYPSIDPDGLLEYSVVYTDRALNHMSQKFQGVMRDISAVLKSVYNAPCAIVVPGSGTFGMESVARQFATGRKVLVIRNGWFSFRWSQILRDGRGHLGDGRPEGSARRAREARPPLRRLRSRKWSRRSASTSRRWSSRLMWKPRRESSCRRTISAPWPMQSTKWAACSSSIASLRAPSGWTWRRSASMC